MQTRQLGRTGLRVPVLCLGTMTFGLQCDRETSFAILDAAVAGGITFIDTADVYPLGGTLETVGRTEEILGEWMARRGNRQRLILATKCMGPMGSGPNEWGLSRLHVQREFTTGRTVGPNDSYSRKFKPNYNLNYSDSFLNNRLGIVISAQESNLYNEQYRVDHTYNRVPTATDTRPQVLTQVLLKDGPKWTNRQSYTGVADFKASEHLTLSLSTLYSSYHAQFYNRQVTMTAGGTQQRADLAQGLRIGGQDQVRVATVEGCPVQVQRKLAGERGLLGFARGHVGRHHRRHHAFGRQVVRHGRVCAHPHVGEVLPHHQLDVFVLRLVAEDLHHVIAAVNPRASWARPSALAIRVLDAAFVQSPQECRVGAGVVVKTVSRNLRLKAGVGAIGPEFALFVVELRVQLAVGYRRSLQRRAVKIAKPLRQDLGAEQHRKDQRQ